MSNKINTKFGTAYLSDRGYYLVYIPKLKKRVMLHRLIYEDYHGVSLLDGIVIHHIDGDKQNNNIDNLQPMTQKEHTKLHKRSPYFPEWKTQNKITSIRIKKSTKARLEKLKRDKETYEDVLIKLIICHQKKMESVK